MSKGEILGKGMTAEVYAWEDDKVLKLYYDSFSKDCIDFEVGVSKIVYEAGVSSPEVFGIVSLEGRLGIIFQRIYGQSMLRAIEAKPWKLGYCARSMARMHAQMHLKITQDLPNQKENLINSISSSSDLLDGKEKIIIGYLMNLPDGTSVCHGDFHPDNIIVANDEMVAIDWINVSSGNPFADVARTWLMVRSPALPPGVSKLSIIVFKLAKKLISHFYLKEYMRYTNTDYCTIDDWILPVAAARLREKIPGEEKWLLRIIDEQLKRLDVCF